jgi:tripartite-type tricarboxylate transporter receptor subunit TctC
MARRTFVRAALGVAAGLAIPLPAHAAADDYPRRPVRVLVAAQPGSGADIVARVATTRLSEVLGQQFVIDNRAGVGGNLGAEMAARATPDGYTLFVAAPAHVIAASLFRKPGYDFVRDFAPIALLTTGQYCVTITPSLPAKTVKELVAHAKARPGQLNYGSAGRGNATHLAGELFRLAAGIDIVHVPYKGSSTALIDVAGGQLHLLFPNLTAVLPHMKSGKVRVLASTGERRSKSTPDLPTVIEAGLPGYSVTAWFGILAPAATAKPVVAKLNAAVVKVMGDPVVAERLSAEGAEPTAGTPDAFATLIRAEAAKWAKVTKAAGMEPE